MCQRHPPAAPAVRQPGALGHYHRPVLRLHPCRLQRRCGAEVQQEPLQLLHIQGARLKHIKLTQLHTLQAGAPAGGRLVGQWTSLFGCA